jgi:HEAT repeat protein/lysophospholipase L1-like esterase
VTEPPSTSASSTPVLNLLLALGVSVGMLGLGEGLARLYETRLPDPEGDRLALWEKEWGDDYYVLRSQSIGWPARDPVNHLGLPDRTHALQKPEGVFRLAILGDSTTAGTPFKREESFPYALQALYDERSPWAEVFTVALWGWSTRQERRAFLELARPYEPDLVLLVVCLNDMEELQNNLSRPSDLLGWLHRRSALVRRIVDAEARSIRDVEELLTDSENTRRAQGRFFAELDLLRSDVEAADAGLAVLLLPVESQVEGRSESRLPQERVGAWCAEHGIRFIDPIEALPPGRGLFEDIVHLSPEGRRVLARHLLDLGLLPPEATDVTALRAALDPEDPAEAGLGQLAEALERADSSRERAEAAWQIGRRPPPPEMASPLLAALGDESEAVRAEASRALGALDDPSAEVLDALTRTLGDERQAVRWRAIEALVALHPDVEEVWPALQAGLENDDPYVRAGALWCLRQVGPPAAEAVPAITRVLREDADPGVRVVATRTLAVLGASDDETLAALEATLGEPGDDDVRRRAARALGRLGPRAARATPVLVEALSDPNGHVRTEAATALGRIHSGSPEVVGALVEATGDEGNLVREAAAVALGRLGPPQGATGALEDLLDDEDGAVREAARRALERAAEAPAP